MTRKSQRSNKGQPPKRYDSYVMSGKSSHGSDEELDNTIRETSTEVQMEAIIANLKLQMEELAQSLQLERSERERLAALLAEKPDDTTNPTVIPSTPQTVSPSTTAIHPANPNSSQHTVNPITNSMHDLSGFSSTSNQNTTPIQQSQVQFPLHIVQSTSAGHHTAPPNHAIAPQTTSYAYHYGLPAPVYAGMNMNNSSPSSTPSAMQSSIGTYRKIVDLPRFGGKVEDWPAFNAAYTESTARLGYQNWENHLRLTKALYGEAREAVESRLIHPDNVNLVMVELATQFGQSEHLLRSQLAKAKNIQAIPENRLDLLIPFATKDRNLAAFLESMNSLPHLANPNLIDELVKKLPPSKMVDWGMHAINIKPYVTIRNFSEWVSNLAHVISLINVAAPSSEPAKKVHKQKVLHVNEISKKDTKCTYCQCNHLVAACPEFAKLSVNERWSSVKQSRLCFSCLRYGHPTFSCRSKKPCNISGCKRSHHALLHDTQRIATTPNEVSNNDPSPVLLSHSPDVSEPCTLEVLFKIIPVVLYGHNETKLETFALIDEGSSITMVDESVLRKLNVKGKSEPLCLQWFGSKSSIEESEIVDLHISGTSPRSPKYQLKNVRSVKNINLPSQTLSMSKMPHQYRAIRKLPINQYQNVKPLVLIGLDNASLGAPSDSTSGHTTVDEPIAVKTKLGWLVYGPCDSPRRHPHTSLHIRTSADPSDDARLENVMENYFTAESFGVKVAEVESASDRTANELLQSTTMKIGDRFQTGLLWKNVDITLPPSFEMAKRRLLLIEKKMSADPEFKERYLEMVNSFIIKGYARKLNSTEAAVSTKRTWYLPHFATSNPNKPGKYRLVFDAAARAHGVSLNDNLLKGPDLYNPLVSVLFNFRSKRVGICGDIMEMFSQIQIQPTDVHAQRFLWRNGESGQPVDIYVMEAMTFGVTCSPASAHHVKNCNAKTFSAEYPEAVNSILHHHYVDDFVDSFESVEEAKRVSSEVSWIHSKAGFTLRGFASNEPEVASYMNGGVSQSQPKPMNLENSTTEKILGLIWDTDDDCFKFKLTFNKVTPDVINGVRRPTKRELLSILMSVFDPFGFLSNIMIYPKVMMQELWRRQVGWDDPVPEDVCAQWLQWREVLERVKEFKLPRFYFTGIETVVDLQLHTFVDASQDSFAAVTYLRVYDGVRAWVIIASAKTRCAPIKKLMSIPRLELQSAVMGTRICASIQDNHQFQVSRRVFWSDSSTVVAWIQSDHRRYKPFVAHRISEILDTTKPSEWRWISTKLNVADNATRAKYPIIYDPKDSWVSGPSFLSLKEEQWPSRVPNTPVKDDSELNTKFVNLIASKVSPLVNVTRFSTFLRAMRVLGWVRRFINTKCKSTPLQKGELTVTELQQAEHTLCFIVQQEVYGEELHDLRTKQTVSKSSPIYKLSPVIDDDGLIRLNGRIGRSDVVPICTKRPVILPKAHPFTKMLVRHYHYRMKHHNRNAIIAEISRKYWIPSVSSLVHKCKSECALCKYYLAKPNPPMMSELPFDRVTAFVRPFTYCGVDYFGPYEVSIGRRREKRWVALFTCLTIRAVHLELAKDMSTDAFLLCLRNFINRRGVPIRMRSDNGTNFVGASKEIDYAIDCLDQDRIQAELSSKNIEWLFNCPDNPHAGGSWERLVQAVKKVLSFTLHEEAPRVETLGSLLIEAENIVNSRPLTGMQLSHEDEEPLTPNHFLIGCANSTQTPGSTNEKIWCMRKQWRICQQLKNRLWKKWIGEYLPLLIRRSKWIEKAKPLAIGDLVLVVDPALARPKWKRGRIIEVFPASDGQVRSAAVSTSTGVLKRPAVKLALLDVKDGESQDDSRGGVSPPSPNKHTSGAGRIETHLSCGKFD